MKEKIALLILLILTSALHGMDSEIDFYKKISDLMNQGLNLNILGGEKLVEFAETIYQSSSNKKPKENNLEKESEKILKLVTKYGKLFPVDHIKKTKNCIKKTKKCVKNLKKTEQDSDKTLKNIQTILRSLKLLEKEFDAFQKNSNNDICCLFGPISFTTENYNVSQLPYGELSCTGKLFNPFYRFPSDHFLSKTLNCLFCKLPGKSNKVIDVTNT